MHKSLKTLVFCLTLFQVDGLAHAMTSDPESVNDVRILIDVSGSMKHNDPANLRIPAIELLINLLPLDTRAGIWLFAQQTHVLVPFAKVDEAWKKKAMEAMGQVHSRGLLTNIEEALQVAADDWIDHSTKQRRNLILLTDGMVDIAKDFMLNADSRDRIITTLTPMLQQAGVQVHTIALSANADRALMEKLAFDTNGWSEMVDSADQLQRVFLKMFKKAVPQDTVPIENNQFTIDSRIKEFSLLLFRKPGAAACQLNSPNSILLSQSNTPEGVRWLHEDNYDLVTVKNPKPGKWEIKSEMDPDNQVMIVTDLKLKLNAIPNHVNASEPLDLVAHFTDRNDLITRDDFLNLITFKVQQTDSSGKHHEWLMAENKEKKGFFSQQLDKTLTPGKHDIKLIADGKTFTREILRSIEIIDMPFKLTKLINHDEQTVKIQLFPDKNVIDTSFMSVQALINHPPHETQTINVSGEQGIWTINVNAPKKGEQVIVNFSVMAKSMQGHPITPNIQPVIIDDQYIKQLEPPESEESIVEQPIAEQQAELKDNDSEEISEQQIESELDWKVTIGIVIGINLALIICGYLLYRYQQKHAAEKQAQLLERLT